ncbi:MAG TPA: stage II sporulation protein M [Cyclobacteriaceae bacterium]|nr:stage II sporulation protein M [Cyclobacteriaceae bacterium]HMV11034.1 stage II sporulation protein M [Cyclobacteriaceae bacterium]HMV88633.1 stage II sporulation protein M [Cyclobacteriaceae bacterium]HMX00605.1 stage II sporulation protein M [Cyclobacteriaceae bacterium]HMX49520.1 stage II sporulation protein M [Cyclobacteriaceae bacterium]
MKETRFVRQNKEKWLQSEQLLEGENKDPEKLSTLFTQVVDDLSYSQTYYKNRSVRVYLNNIARNFFSVLSNKRRDNKNHFKNFWISELPQIVIYCRKELLISLAVFLLAAAIGVLSTARDENFPAYIMGDQYMEMTKENIKKGDPMAVYKDQNQLEMAWSIITNNIGVAFRTYVLGIFLSIGTLLIMIYNGIMIGTFQYYFAQQDLLATSAMTVWLHGTLEISSIVIAGGAGLTLGSGLLFPGTYTRLQAFQLSAVRSLKLVFGIAPILVIAGIIESFLTRYTEVPAFIKLTLIILSALFIVGYFIVYPWWRMKKGFPEPLHETKLQANKPYHINYAKIKNQAEILGDSFNFYKRNFGLIFRWTLLFSIIGTVVYYFTYEQELLLSYTDPMGYWLGEMFFGIKLDTLPKLIVAGFTTAGLATVTSLLIMKDSGVKEITAGVRIQAFIKNLVIIALLFAMPFWWGGFGYTLLALSFGLIFFIAFGVVKRDAFQATWTALGQGFGQVFGLQVVLLFTAMVFLFLAVSPLMYLYTEAVAWNLSGEKGIIEKITYLIEIFFKLLMFNLILPLVCASMSFIYYSLQEISFANELKLSIAKITLKKSRARNS